MKVPKDRRGLKRLPAAQISVGDWVYKAGLDDYFGYFLMIVDSHEGGQWRGRWAFRIAGNVYRLVGNTSGRSHGYFLG